MEMNYIYLIHIREFITTNKNIYKIGKTKQEHFKLINQYPIGSILHLYTSCIDCNKAERDLISIFKKKFIHKKIYGNKYFEGELNEMRHTINEYINFENSNNEVLNNDSNNINIENINEELEDNKKDDDEELKDNKELQDENTKKEELEDNYYECKRCLYKTNRLSNIKLHLNRIKKCECIEDALI
jgi:hypothetical protein